MTGPLFPRLVGPESLRQFRLYANTVSSRFLPFWRHVIGVVAAPASAAAPDGAVCLHVNSPSGRRVQSLDRAGDYLIGGGPGCDLIVPGVPLGPAFKLTLSIQGHERQGYISILKDGVRIDGDATIAGEIYQLRPASVVGYAGLTFDLTGLTSRNAAMVLQRAMAGSASWRGLWTLIPATCLLVYGGLGLRSPETSIELGPPVPAMTSTAQAVTALRDALLSARIDAKVSLSPGQQEIEVDATAASLDADGERHLQSLMNAVQRSTEKPIVDVSGPSSRIGGSIAAIATSPIKLVVARDGRRYHIGDKIDTSWTITKISSDAISVRRNRVLADIEIPGRRP